MAADPQPLPANALRFRARFSSNRGPQEIPADESYTVSKAIIKAGGFRDFANKRKVKLTRKGGKDFVIDLKRVIEEGHTEEDVVLQPDDQIYVPQRLINM